MEIYTPLALAEWAIDFARRRVCLSAATELISGFGAPARTAIPIPLTVIRQLKPVLADRADGTRLATKILAWPTEHQQGLATDPRAATWWAREFDLDGALAEEERARFEAHLAEPGALRPEASYTVAVQLSLDTSQLPKPIQVSALGSTEWRMSSGWARFTHKVEPK